MDEIMNYDDVVVEDEFDVVETEDCGSGMSTGVAMAIGAGLTLAIGAAVKFGKKLWDKHKAKKELRKVEEGTVVEVTDDQIQEVTK